jgi:hypothetical protein
MNRQPADADSVGLGPTGALPIQRVPTERGEAHAWERTAIRVIHALPDGPVAEFMWPSFMAGFMVPGSWARSPPHRPAAIARLGDRSPAAIAAEIGASIDACP